LTDALLERNFAIRYIDVGRHPLADIDVGAAHLVIGLGGPVAVYDHAKYPWMRHELALFERAVKLDKPILLTRQAAKVFADWLTELEQVTPG
jgi:GMP synthase (glutamine-hydrolysing)